MLMLGIPWRATGPPSRGGSRGGYFPGVPLSMRSEQSSDERSRPLGECEAEMGGSLPTGFMGVSVRDWRVFFAELPAAVAILIGAFVLLLNLSLPVADYEDASPAVRVAIVGE